MTEKIVISSVAKFISLAREAPGLLNIGSLSLLKSATLPTPSKPTIGKGCNCGKKANGFDVSILRPQFEAAMLTLSDSDKSNMKKLLSAETICYYVKNNIGQLKQTCF